MLCNITVSYLMPILWSRSLAFLSMRVDLRPSLSSDILCILLCRPSIRFNLLFVHSLHSRICLVQRLLSSLAIWTSLFAQQQRWLHISISCPPYPLIPSLVQYMDIKLHKNSLQSRGQWKPHSNATSTLVVTRGLRYLSKYSQTGRQMLLLFWEKYYFYLGKI